MTSSRTVRFLVQLTFDDGHEAESSFEVECTDEGSPALPEESIVRLVLGGTATDDGARQRVIEALRSRVDEILDRALPESDLDGSIDAAAGELIGDDDGGPTPTQRNKFDAFARHEHREMAAQVLRSYLSVATTLTSSDLGTYWGVTVAPSARTLLRVNVGSVEVLAVLQSGSIIVYLQGDPPPTRPAYASEMGEGLETAAPNFTYTLEAGAIAAAFADPVLTARVNARIDAAWRRLPRANWHNPLTESLLRSTA